MEITNTINGLIDSFKRLPITQEFLNEDKILEFWKNSFTDVDENVNDLYKKLEERNRIRLLKEILLDAYQWCVKLNNLLVEAERALNLPDSLSDLERSQPADKLWDGLLNNDVHPKKILCILYPIIRKGNMDNSRVLEKELSLLACAIYLNLLSVKGHIAFRIFQPSFIDEIVKAINPNNVNLKRPAANKLAVKRGKQKRFDQEEFQEEILSNLSMDDENEDHFPSGVSNCLNINLKIHLIKQILNALYKLVEKISFRNYQDELRDLIKVLIGLGLHYSENQTEHNNHTINGMTFSIVKSIASCELHGHSGMIYMYIMENLLIQFLDVVAEKKNPKASNHLVQIKRFLVKIVNEGGQEVKKPSQIFFHQLCARVCDKTEGREKMAHQGYEIISHFPDELFVDLVKWSIKHSSENEVSQRMISLDILSCLLQDEAKIKIISEFPDATPLFVIGKILNRCYDKSSTVVVKALNVLSRDKILDFLTQNDQSNENIGIQRKLFKNLEKIAKHLVENDKVFVRKSTLILIRKIMCQRELEPQYYKIFAKFATDPSVLIRKEMCQSISLILKAHPDSELAQNLFIKNLLPVLLDCEESAQQKCMDQLDEIILDGILTENQIAWVILSRICQTNMKDYQGYIKVMLQKILNKNKCRLSSPFVMRLRLKLTTEFESVAWMLLAQLTSCKNFPDTNYEFAIYAWREKKNHPNEMEDENFKNIVETIGNSSLTFSKNALQSLVEHFQTDITAFSVPLVAISSTIIALRQMLTVLTNKRSYGEDLERFAEANLKRCDSKLSHFFEVENFEAIDGRENEALRVVETYSILSEISPKNVTTKTEEYLIFLAFRKECNKIKKMSILCLGRLCVQDEKLTHKTLLLFVQELKTSSDPNVIINILTVLCDFCNRYASIIEPYLNIMSNCFKHPSKFVCYQALTLFARLLQENILKWKGSLFFRFLYVVINPDLDLSLYAKSLLIHLGTKRYPNFFVQRFTETIFFLNGFEKTLEPLKDSQDEHFTLKGEENCNLRMKLYKFMIENTKPEFRFVRINSTLIEHGLGKFIDREKIMNDQNKFIITDVLNILLCEELKDCSSFINALEESGLKPKWETQLGKKAKGIVVGKVVNAVIGLKSIVKKTPVMKNYMQFLAEYTKEFKNELKEMLAEEPQLAKEIQYDIGLMEKERNKSVPSPELIFSSDEEGD